MGKRIDIDKLAKLANIDLDDKERESFSNQLETVISYIDTLESLDVSGLEPTFTVNDQLNVMREDKVNLSDSLSNEEVLLNAPKKNKDSFLVPKVIS